jgi:uracil-DNA glycosylase
MPPGRSIPRSPSTRPRKPRPPDDASAPPADLLKASGELATLSSRIRACEACDRACDARAFGTGFPRAPIMLVKDRPSTADIETAGAFADEAEALAKAFEALSIPLAWTYGSTAVRCGDGPATLDQVKACSVHLLIEIEAVMPQVLVAFGPRALDAVRTLDGRCGLAVPDEVASGEAVRLRSDLTLVVTEPLPDGLTGKEAKRRLWKDLRLIPGLIGDRDVG